MLPSHTFLKWIASHDMVVKCCSILYIDISALRTLRNFLSLGDFFFPFRFSREDAYTNQNVCLLKPHVTIVLYELL